MNTTISSPSISSDEAFARLGRITRQLHEAMSELGLERGLLEIASEIPDARDRLSHVGQMTESAATRVLNLVDIAQPQCQVFKERSRSLVHAVSQLRQRSPEGNSPHEIHDLMAVCDDFTEHSSQFAEQQSAVLGDIMMAQDFQDLSGQIIKKVIDIISLTEQQLLSLLMHSAPEHLVGDNDRGQLAGPQVPDKALKQNDVDDLLASLGF
jgi:chemotaxis protein CheZ